MSDDLQARLYATGNGGRLDRTTVSKGNAVKSSGGALKARLVSSSSQASSLAKKQDTKPKSATMSWAVGGQKSRDILSKAVSNTQKVNPVALLRAAAVIALHRADSRFNLPANGKLAVSVP
jgi:hypothetical protein